MPSKTKHGTTKSLAQRVAEMLKQRGVQRIFGVPGGGSSLDLIEAAAEQDIDFVLCRTETGAAIMAAVTGELTGIPGIVLTGIGPGAASAVNGITYASLERAPIIIFTDAHEVNATEPPHQIFDQQSLFAPISKAQQRLTPSDGATSFERLINLSAAEPPGPVHFDLSAKDACANSPRSSYDEVETKTDPNPEMIDAAGRLIRAAARPVMIVGLQCRSSDRADAANNLVSMLGAPVLATYKAKGVIPDTHPLYVGLYTGAKLDNTVLTEADLIIFFGADPIEMIPGDWPHSAPVIVISETPQLAWPFKPKTELTGSVLKNARALGIHRNNTAWTKLEIETHRKRLRNAIAIRKTAGRSPDEIINAVIATAPKNSRLAVDAGAHMFSCMTHWPADRPHDVLKSNGLSTMGFAIPAALASCLQEPNRPAIALTGDGGMMMSMAELSTAVRLGVNLTVVVMNDAALSLIDIKQQRQQRPPLGVRYPREDFANIARGLGCDAWKVGALDPLEFALTEAFEAEGPTLIDATVDPSGYRDQLIALRG
ncbi:MAG: thiamine pyrophosphate-binding protein [Pseudomonadota bacterium]|nr:thiamine pyrophosphate-binding protein [Pseudomonadota bacterium]